MFPSVLSDMLLDALYVRRCGSFTSRLRRSHDPVWTYRNCSVAGGNVAHTGADARPAWRLPREQPSHLRQLPHPTRSGRRVRDGQATLRRPAGVGHPHLQGAGRQYHSGSRDGHRRLGRSRYQARPGGGRPAERLAARADHALWILQGLHRAGSRCGRGLCPLGCAGRQQGAGARLQGPAARRHPARCREADDGGRSGHSRQARVLSRHHRPLHGMSHPHEERAA